MYFPFWRCLKSALISAHVAAGSGDICSGYLAGLWVLIWQVWQFLMFSSTRGCVCLNQTFSWRRTMVFTMPWCPACAILATLVCSISGSTIGCPLRMMLSLVCRVWNVALFMPSLTACHLLVRMSWMTVVSVLSFAVSVATSSIVIALGVDVVCVFLCYFLFSVAWW